MMKFATFENIVEQIYKHVMPKPKDQCSSFEQLGVSFVDRMLIEHVFIEYADGMAKLPVQQASRMLYRYSLPNESKKPRTLSKLSDRSAWERRMSKGKVAVQKMVVDLMELYLHRLKQRRTPYPKSPAMAEFTSQFPFEPTLD